MLDLTAQVRSSFPVEKVESGVAQFQLCSFDNGVTDVSSASGPENTSGSEFYFRS